MSEHSDKHSHKCTYCGTIWCHDLSGLVARSKLPTEGFIKDFMKAHSCPSCGEYEDMRHDEWQHGELPVFCHNHERTLSLDLDKSEEWRRDSELSCEKRRRSRAAEAFASLLEFLSEDEHPSDLGIAIGR